MAHGLHKREGSTEGGKNYLRTEFWYVHYNWKETLIGNNEMIDPYRNICREGREKSWGRSRKSLEG